MANEAGTLIGASAWRISRLLSDGQPDFGNATGAFNVCGGITTVTHDFEIEDGQEIFVRDSVGTACINIVRLDQVKYATGEITLCKDQDEIWEILGLASLLLEGDDERGRYMAFASGCAAPTAAYVSLELWTEVYDCDELRTPYSWRRIVFPRARFTPAPFDIGEDPSTPTFRFKAFNNSNFTDGPFGDLDILVANGVTSFGMAVIDEANAPPTCADPPDYVAIPAAAS